MTDLEQALVRLGAEIVFPDTPDVAVSVRRRLVERPPRRGQRLLERRMLAIAFALLALAVGAAMAVPSARSAILEFFHLRGASVERVDTLPRVPSRLARVLELGNPVRIVDRLLDDIASSYEDVWRDRADLRDEIERLEGELQRQREIEEALRNTLLSAERMADELRARAHHEADLIVEEARAKAREIAAAAEGDEQRVRDEIRRLRALETDVRAEFRAFLASALERLGGDSPDTSGGPRPDPHQAA